MNRIALGAALVCAVAAAQSQPQLPNMPQTPEEHKFYAAVSRAVTQVMPLEKGRFVLTLGDRANPSFPGEERNNFEQVPCERLAAFGFLGYATELGKLTAAACKNGARVRELSANARARVPLMMAGLPIKEDDARKLGWYYAQETLGDGAEFHYFPLIAVGHGVLGAYSGVLYDKKTGGAVVIQAEARQMCGEHFVKEFKDAPFCTDMRGTLKRLAQSIRAAL
jgi:hypothetical protein